MADDPFTVAENVVVDNRRDRRIDGNLVRCLICLAVAAGGFGWTIFRTDLSRKPGLPDQANNLTHQMKALQGDPDRAAQPESARRFGVKVGDTVEISALNPAIAAHHALITGMNDDQLTIRIGSDIFAIRWENIDRLKAESK